MKALVACAALAMAAVLPQWMGGGHHNFKLSVGQGQQGARERRGLHPIHLQSTASAFASTARMPQNAPRKPMGNTYFIRLAVI